MNPLRRIALIVLDFWPFLALLAAWDLWVVIGGFTTTVAPRPWAVFASFVTEPLTYLAPTGWTLVDALAGLVLGLAFGAAAAIAVHLWSIAAGMVTPLAVLLRSVPITALIPIIAAIAGYGDGTSILAIATIAFFPTFSFALSGLRSVAPAGHDLLSVLGAGRLTRLLQLELPATLPGLAVAFRMTTPLAVGGAVLAEMLVGTRGLGHRFVEFRAYGHAEQMWGSALLALVVTVLAFLAARRIETFTTARFS